VAVEAVVCEALAFRTRLYYALTPTALIISNQESFLRQTIDATATTGEPAWHAQLELTPARWQASRPALLLAYEEAAREACRKNLAVATHLLHATPGLDPARRSELELCTFGREGACPDGGEYALGDDGLARCSCHGSWDHPTQLREPAPESAFRRVLDRLAGVRLSLRLTGEGLHTLIELQRR
jgi:hypothetical protein